MHKNGDYIKNFNMKVAGTLAVKKKIEEPALTSFRYQDVSFEGLTAKQRKNLKKKLNRKRKKMEASQNASQAAISQSETSKSSMIDTEKGEDEDNGEEPELKEIEIEDIAVGTNPKANNEIEGKKKPKANNTAS